MDAGSVLAFVFLYFLLVLDIYKDGISCYRHRKENQASYESRIPEELPYFLCVNGNRVKINVRYRA